MKTLGKLLAICALSTVPTGGGVSSQGPGDTKVNGEVSTSMPQAEIDELLDLIGVIDPQTQDAITAALAAGDIGIGNLSRPRAHVGTHDKTTILVNTGYYGLATQAVAIMHEWRHVERIPEESPDDAQDSDDDDPCDPCAHARNHAQTQDDLICMAD